MNKEKKRYQEQCKILTEHVQWYVDCNKLWSKDFKSQISKLCFTQVTDMTFLDRKWNGGVVKVGNCIKSNSILACAMSQRYKDVSIRCVVQNGSFRDAKRHLFHCYVVIPMKGKGVGRSKRNRLQPNVECEMVFDYSNGKRRVWPHEYYEANLQPSSRYGKKPEIWEVDICVRKNMTFDWLMYQIVSSSTFCRNYQWQIDHGHYKKEYDVDRILSNLLGRRTRIVACKDETYLLQEEEDGCLCDDCIIKKCRNIMLKKQRSP